MSTNQSQSLPAIFVSHGAPLVAIDDTEVHNFLEKLGDVTPKPKGILAVSAHWETETPFVSSAEKPETIYDFYGFPDELYTLTYPAPGAPELAERTAELLVSADLGPVTREDRGLDHGAWVPLLLGYPEADIPVTQLSIQSHLDPAHHYRLGEALRPLRDEGILILASGNITHNLGEFRGRAVDAEPPEWVKAFDEWASWAICEGRVDDLLNYRTRAPEAVRNHPTDEHLLPLFVALGAGTSGESRHLHKSYTYGVLAMDAYAFL